MSKKKNRKKKAESPGHILSREERIKEIQGFTLMSDIFLSVVLEDIPACEHILRILTGIKGLKVKEVKTQYSISKLNSHSSRLDVLAEDTRGKLYNIEIQRSEEKDAPRRVRYYGALIDGEFLGKGRDYSELPDIYIIYLSEKDIWKQGKARYRVCKTLDDTGEEYDDGCHILYVNAEVDDGTRAAKLMKYFRTSDPQDKSEGELSRRVHYLKSEEGGREYMCELTERIERRGETRGELRSRKNTACNLARMGMAPEQISEAVEENVAVVRKWISESGKAI